MKKDRKLISEKKIPFSKIFYTSQKTFIKKACLSDCTKKIFKQELKQVLRLHKYTRDTVFMITHEGVINAIDDIIDTERIDIAKYVKKKLIKMPLIHENYNASKVCSKCKCCEDKSTCALFAKRYTMTRLYAIKLDFSDVYTYE